MAHAQDVRRSQFAAFIRRATEHAQITRGWSIRRIGTESGVSDSTIHRWLSGDWAEDPRGGQVEKFCVSLEIPPSIAFTILWPGGNAPDEPEPLPTEPDLRKLQAALMDPDLSDEEKFHIRTTIRTLAAHIEGARRSRRAS